MPNGRPPMGALLWLRNHYDTLAARIEDLEECGLVPEAVKVKQRELRAKVLVVVDKVLEGEVVENADSLAFRVRYLRTRSGKRKG